MQRASQSLTDIDSASGGVFRMYGRWSNSQKEGDSGSLVFKIEHSHSYLDQISPDELSGQIGYLGSTGTLYSDQELVLNDFNWLQKVDGGKGGVIFGRYDVNDYMDVVDYADPWTTFQNSNILENPNIQITELNAQEVCKSTCSFNRPLSYLSLALNYYFNNTDPFGYHVVNFIIHACSTICLFLLTMNH